MGYSFFSKELSDLLEEGFCGISVSVDTVDFVNLVPLAGAVAVHDESVLGQNVESAFDVNHLDGLSPVSDDFGSLLGVGAGLAQKVGVNVVLFGLGVPVDGGQVNVAVSDGSEETVIVASVNDVARTLQVGWVDDGLVSVTLVQEGGQFSAAL